MSKYDLIVFDVDGTLLDTSKGIFNSVRYAEKMMGFNPIPDDRLKEFVGPPPKQMYMNVYGVSEDRAMLAARFHREYGRTKAIYEAVPYIGMEATLIELKKRDYKLGVATLKTQSIAEKVLKITGLLKYFDAIVGMDDSESLTKADTIRLVMEKTDVAERSRTLMIGDSEYDKIGADEIGVDFIAALYGFGDEIFMKNQNTYIKEAHDILSFI